MSSRENLVERVVPHGTIERVTVLRRFVSMADTATALDGMPSEEPTRARVVEAFDAWIEAEPHSFSGPIPRPVLRKEAV